MKKIKPAACAFYLIATLLLSGCTTTSRQAVGPLPTDLICARSLVGNPGEIIERSRGANLNTEKKFKKFYGYLEEFTLKNGRKLRGAALCYNTSVIFIHTKNGIQKVSKSTIDHMRFLN